MQPADHDPLQFSTTCTQDDPDDELPPAYGHHDAAAPSAPPAPAVLEQHDPLAAPAQRHQQEQQQQQHTWQHYPEPAAPGGGGHPPAQPQYPSVPAPADSPVSLGSPASSSMAGSLDGVPCGTAGAAAGAAAALPHGSSMAASNPALRITVLNPLRHMGPSAIPGLEEAYMSYEVVTATSLPHFSGQHFSVRRRFRDFVSLSNLLPKLLHGSFLPARPEKNVIEGRRMTECFVEARRAALERYLNRLAAHAGAARSEVLRVFLEADGNLRSHPQWRALKPTALTPTQATSRLIRSLVGVRKNAPTPSEVVQPAGACRDVYRLLHEQVAALRGTFKHAPVSAEERALRDDTALVSDAAGALHVALSRGEAWCRLAAARAALLPGLGLALQALATFEGSYSYGNTATTRALAAAAQAAQAGGAAAASSSASASGALQPLRDHHAAGPNTLAALRAREAQLLTVMTLRQDLEGRRARLAAAQLTPASQAKRVDTLRTQVGQLEVSVAAAEAEYGRQLVRNREELAALRASRGAELAAMAADLVSLQLKHEQQEAALWQQLLQKLPQPPAAAGAAAAAAASAQQEAPAAAPP